MPFFRILLLTDECWRSTETHASCHPAHTTWMFDCMNNYVVGRPVNCWSGEEPQEPCERPAPSPHGCCQSYQREGSVLCVYGDVAGVAYSAFCICTRGEHACECAWPGLVSPWPPSRHQLCQPQGDSPLWTSRDCYQQGKWHNRRITRCFRCVPNSTSKSLKNKQCWFIHFIRNFRLHKVTGSMSL